VSRNARYSDPKNSLQGEYDAEIAANPPVIDWTKRNHHGVLIGTVIEDPHADCPNRNPTKPRKTA